MIHQTSFLFAQSQGLVLFKFNYSPAHEREIKVYHSPTDSILFFVCAGRDSLAKKISPFEDCENSDLIYQLAGESEKRFAIYDNENPTHIYWIEKDSLMEFWSWSKYWLNNDGVSSIALVRKKPDDVSPEVKIPGLNEYYYFVEAVQGDFMLVSYGRPTMVNSENFRSGMIGWVRWRKGNKILAGITYPE